MMHHAGTSAVNAVPDDQVDVPMKVEDANGGDVQTVTHARRSTEAERMSLQSRFLRLRQKNSSGKAVPEVRVTMLRYKVDYAPHARC
eukprot:6492168-Amphidinium_carterae.2